MGAYFNISHCFDAEEVHVIFTSSSKFKIKSIFFMHNNHHTLFCRSQINGIKSCCYLMLPHHGHSLLCLPLIDPLFGEHIYVCRLLRVWIALTYLQICHGSDEGYYIFNHQSTFNGSNVHTGHFRLSPLPPAYLHKELREIINFYIQLHQLITNLNTSLIRYFKISNNAHM